MQFNSHSHFALFTVEPINSSLPRNTLNLFKRINRDNLQKKYRMVKSPFGGYRHIFA
jgi:hypothetical protein